MLEGLASKNILIKEVHFQQGHFFDTGLVPCTNDLIQLKWKPL